MFGNDGAKLFIGTAYHAARQRLTADGILLGEDSTSDTEAVHEETSSIVADLFGSNTFKTVVDRKVPVTQQERFGGPSTKKATKTVTLPFPVTSGTTSEEKENLFKLSNSARSVSGVQDIIDGLKERGFTTTDPYINQILKSLETAEQKTLLGVLILPYNSGFSLFVKDKTGEPRRLIFVEEESFGQEAKAVYVQFSYDAMTSSKNTKELINNAAISGF